MDPHRISAARTCLDGAHTDTMSFPQIVAALAAEGFEGYAVDFRRGTATYYLPDGDSVELAKERPDGPIAAALDAAALQAAIREAQRQAPGYSYRGFCAKAAGAGCAGYMVSFSGRRALYYGRTGETHVEPFPQ